MKSRIWLVFALLISLFGSYTFGYYKGSQDTKTLYSTLSSRNDPYFTKVNRVPVTPE